MKHIVPLCLCSFGVAYKFDRFRYTRGSSPMRFLGTALQLCCLVQNVNVKFICVREISVLGISF